MFLIYSYYWLVCPLVFYNQLNYEVHLKEHHPDLNAKSTCIRCNLNVNIKNVFEHFLNCHSISEFQ